MIFKTVVNEWIRPLAKSTQVEYLREAARFAAWLYVRSKIAPYSTEIGAAIAIVELLKNSDHNDAAGLFSEYLAEKSGVSTATANRAMYALQSLSAAAKRLGVTGYRVELPALPSEPYRDTAGPGIDQIRKILDNLADGIDRLKYCKKTAKADERARMHRDRAMILLGATEGLRRGEIASIQCSEYEAYKRKIWIKQKGKRAGVQVEISRDAARAIAAWRNCRQRLVRDQKDRRLFGLSADGVSEAIQRRAAQAGVETTAHGLRHTFVTELLNLTGGATSKVMAASRHADIRAVEIYNDQRGTERRGLISRLVKRIKGEK